MPPSDPSIATPYLCPPCSPNLYNLSSLSHSLALPSDDMIYVLTSWVRGKLPASEQGLARTPCHQEGRLEGRIDEDRPPS